MVVSYPKALPVHPAQVPLIAANWDKMLCVKPWAKRPIVSVVAQMEHSVLKGFLVVRGSNSAYPLMVRARSVPVNHAHPV